MFSKREFLREKSKELRRNMTDVEKKLWRKLRAKQFGIHFYRQRIIDDKYIVDFCCADKKLIIELDGGQHCESVEDKLRDDYLISRGYRVLRFWNNEVNENFDGCLIEILKYIE